MMKMNQVISFMLFVMLGSSSILGQMNVSLLSHVNYNELHNANLNGVWGYTDETGIEYAIVGTSKGTSIVSLADPANPVEVFWEPGMTSIWREVKTWGDYAYITTEADNGLLIIDMSPLPQSNDLPVNYYFGPAGNTWTSAHSLFIDEFGFAYIHGSSRGVGGVIFLDVQTDPMNPIEVGSFENWYVHDSYARNNILYAAHIMDGFFSVVDVSDKANPVLLGTRSTPYNFTHNTWLSDNGQYVYITDEVSGAFIAAYDVSDPQNIFETDRIRNAPPVGVIPHNVHVKNDYLITSYYSDGITIHDASDPYNLVLVGQYDTYPGQTTSFDGCWGVFPYFDSDIILASDITQGLFVLQPTYMRGAYLKGLVTDQETGLAISGADVRILDHDYIDQTNSLGAYATGIVNGGGYSVLYSKIGYYPQVHRVELINNEVVFKDVQLVPIPPFNFDLIVIDAATGTPVSNAKIRLEAELLTHEGVTNGLGVEDFVLYYQEVYRVTVGKWGYWTACFDLQIDQLTGQYAVELEKGFYDDFEFDFGWVSSGNAVTGKWERGIPNPTSSGSAPGFDADYDCGAYAFVTGNSVNPNPDADDVDGGVAILLSPTMDLSTYSDPHVNFALWMYCLHGAPPDDTLKVIVSNGTITSTILRLGSNEENRYKWNPFSIRLSDYIPITSSMQFFFRLSDLDPNVNITEGGVDYFFISNSNTTGMEESTLVETFIYPNPVNDQLILNGFDPGIQFQISDLNGRIVLSGNISDSKQVVSVGQLKSGYYVLRVGERIFKVLKD